MDGAALADEAAAELLHHCVDLHQRVPPLLDGRWVVRVMLYIAIKANGRRHLDRHGPDANRHLQFLERLHHFPVEVGDRFRFEDDAADASVAGLEDKTMIDEVERDLEHRRAIRHR
jgi:hypothetical protein